MELERNQNTYLITYKIYIYIIIIFNFYFYCTFKGQVDELQRNNNLFY